MNCEPGIPADINAIMLFLIDAYGSSVLAVYENTCAGSEALHVASCTGTVSFASGADIHSVGCAFNAAAADTDPTHNCTHAHTHSRQGCT